MWRMILLCLLSLSLFGCATHRGQTQRPRPVPVVVQNQDLPHEETVVETPYPDRPPYQRPVQVPYQYQKPSIETQSYLAQGKRYFEAGYYKRAMHELLPLACDGNAEAQYAVGYMYYYGYGVAQDTDVGYFWIQRSADQQFPQAEVAVEMISQQHHPARKRYR